MSTERPNSADGLAWYIQDIQRRLRMLETRSTGSIIFTSGSNNNLTAIDQATGVETIIGQLPDGSYGLQQHVNDVTPPPVATAPIVSSKPGLVVVTWDGNFVAGAAKPNDFVMCTVIGHKVVGGLVVSQTAVGVVRSAADTCVVSLDIAQPGETWQFSLEATDYNGNRAALSTKSAAVTIQSVVDAAIGAVGADITAAQNAADAAQTAADAAQQSADDAAQSVIDLADVTGAVYTQTATPAADPNGLWIDTGHNNIPRRYLGARNALFVNVGGGASVGSRLTALGWNVTTVTSTPSLATASQYDLVAFDAGYAGLTQASHGALAESLLNKGISIFTSGNDTTALNYLFTGGVNRGTTKNLIRPTGTHPAAQGWTDYADTDLNFYLTGINAAATVTGVTLVATLGTDQPINVVREHPTTFARWVHVQTYASPVNVLNAHLNWLADNWVAVQDQGIIDASNAAATAQSKADQAFNNAATAATAAGTAQTTADGKNRTWYQTTAPAGTSHKAGDLWFDTDDGNKLYMWQTTPSLAWVSVQDTAISTAQGTANTALTSANGKNKNYYQTTQPTGGTYIVGDNWFDTDDNYKLYTYNGTTWQLTQDSAGAITTAAADATTKANAAAAAAIQAQAYQLNPSFDDWTAASAPNNYGLWAGTAVKETSIIRRTPYAVRFSVTGTAQAGLALTSVLNHAPNLDYLVVELEFYLVSGTLDGAGVLVDWNNTVPANYRVTINLKTEVPTPDLGKWYSITKVIKKPTAFTGTFSKINGYLMGSYSGIATGTTKDIIFDWMNIRPATAEEITAYGTPASITTLTNTVNAKTKTYYQTTQPSLTGNTIGDLWFDTSNGNKPYAWNGSAWVSAQDASIATAQGTANTALTSANGKNKVYYQTTMPTGGTYILGDTWFDTSNGNKIYVYNGTTFVVAQDTAIATAQNTANTKTKTYFQTTSPGTTGNTVGDIWFDTSNGNLPYVWNGTAWTSARDATIATAQSTANSALTSANGKNKVYYQTTSPGTTGNTVGDTWFDTSNGNKIYVWSGAAWVSGQDTSIATAQSTANSALTTANSKTKTYFQSTQPGTTGNTTGDIWFDTANGNKPYVWNGTAWTLAQDAAITAAQTSANGKNKVWYQAAQPALTGNTLGDTWFDTDDGNKIYVWSGSAWVNAQDATIATAQSTATNALNTANVKTKTYFQTNQPSLTGNTTGDLWFDTDDGYRPYVWNGTAWTSARDTTIATAQSTANSALTSANGKNKVYYQTTMPTGGTYITGDTWFDTDDGNKIYVYNGTTFVVAQDTAISTAQSAANTAQSTANTALSTANNKTKTYFQTAQPALTGNTVGDMWFDTDDSNKVYVWDGAAWTSARDAGIASATNAAATAQQAANDALSAAQAAQAVADGAIRTFYQADPPTGLNNSSNIGDLWFDTDDGQAYRWSGTAWVIIEDNSIAAALAAAQNAQTTADGKITTYYQPGQPATGEVGDLWFDTDDKNKPYYCSSISPLTWTVVRDGAIADAQSTANTALTSANGKNRVYYQTAMPTGGTYITGDTWFDTDDGNKIYVYNGTTFVVAQDAAIGTAQTTANNAQTAANTAQTTANAKTKTYFQTTQPGLTGNTNGDIWFDTANGNKPYVWNGTAWVTAQDAAIATAQSTANNALTSANGKNKVWYQTAQPGTTGNTVGDTWFDTDDGNKPYVWSGSAWVNAQDATIAAAQNTANTALSTANSKTKTYYQTASPGTTGNTVGDIWFDTANGNKPYVWNGTAWASAQDSTIATAQSTANTALTSANGKNKNYYQTTQPTGGTYIVGDNWFDTDDNYKLYTYNGTTWQLTQDSAGAITAAATDASTKADAAQIAGIQASAYSLNPSFDDWTGTTPNNYGVFNVAPTKETTIVRTGKVSARFNCTDTTTDRGLTASTAIAHAPNLNYFTIEVEVRLVSGTSFGGAGVLLDWGGMTNQRVVLDLSAEIPAPVAGKWYRVVKVFQKPANATGTWSAMNAWLMGQYGIGTRAVKDMVFDWLNIRPSTTEEITAYGTPASITTLTATVNAKTKTYFQSTQPSNTGNTTGDIWFDTGNGNKVYVWNGSAWTVAQDTAITAAQTSANGKNRIYYQTAMPTGGTYIAGDVWFDTDDGYKIYVYNGTAFTASQLGNSAIADLAITNAKIADATIASAKIAQLDAGKITTGTLDANRIGADTITATHIASDAITTNELAANSITADKGQIADAAILTAKIADAQITNAKIADLAVTNAKIADATILTAKIADAQITNAKIADLSVTNAKIADATILSAKIVSLDAGKITTGTLDANRIAAKTITTDKLFVGDLTNLFDNGGFLGTTGLENWAATGWGVVVSDANFLTGKALQNTAVGSYLSRYQTRAVEVQPGDQFFGSATVYSSATAGTIAPTFRMIFRDAANNNISNQGSSTAVTNGTYVSRTQSFTAPAGATNAQLWIEMHNPSGGTQIIGDIVVRRKNTGNLIIDGAITANSAIIVDGAIGTAKIGDLAVSSAKIADLAVTNAKIADATIQSAKIAQLDAGKITTGTLDANRISASSITTDKLSIGDFTNLVDDPDFNTGTGWGLGGQSSLAAISIGVEGTATNALRTVANGTIVDVANKNVIPVLAGDKFYGSVYVKSDGAQTAGTIHFATTVYCADNTNQYPAFQQVSATSISTGWTRLSGVITMPANAIKMVPRISVRNDTTTGTFWWDHVIVRRQETAVTIADGTITAGSAIISTGAIGTAQIANLAVNTAQIADSAITNAKIANLAVDNAKIADATIQSAKIANLDAGKITTGILDANRIGADTITATHIASDAVTANELAANSITAAKGQISDLAVTTAKIADLAVSSAKIADLAVTNAKIADATIASAKIASLDAGKITTGTLDANRIGANTVTTDKLVVGDFTDLVDNGTFESDFLGWTASGATITTTTPYSGTKCAQFTGGNSIVQLRAINVTPGEKLYVSVYYKTTADKAGGGGIRLMSQTGGEGVTWATTYDFGVNTNWTQHTAVATVAAGVTSLKPRLGFALTAGTVWVDNYSVRRQSGAVLIADGAITAGSAIIATGAIGTAQIGNLAVNTAQIADTAITNAKIADLAVTNAKIADATIASAKIANLDAGKITTGTLDAARIGADTITATHIASDAVTANELAANSITAAKGQISDLAVTTAKIADLAITNAKIADATIASAKIAALDAGKITTGTLDANRIGASTITASKLNVSVGGTNIVANSSFEVDSNNDGLADAWMVWTRGAGDAGRVFTNTRVAGLFPGSTFAQRVTSTTVTNTEQSSIQATTLSAVGAGASVGLSIYMRASVAGTYSISLRCQDAAGTYMGDAAFTAAVTTTAARYSGIVVTPAGTTGGKVTVTSPGSLTSGHWFEVDGVQAELGDIVSAWGPMATELLPGTITANMIATGAITANSAIIANGAIGSAQIADLSVNTAEIADSAITNAKIANLAVDNAKIADATIQSAKIAALDAGKITTGYLDAARLAAGTIVAGSAIIANGAIGSAQIGDLQVTTAKIADTAITNAKIANLAVNTAQIADTAITTAKIANLAVDNAQIADSAITNAKIANATIQSAKIGSVDAGTITVGTLNAQRIGTSTITTDKLLISDLTNLWENPDFEGDTVGAQARGTTNNGNATIVDTSALGGTQGVMGAAGNGSNRALALNALNGSNNDVFGVNMIPVQAGDQFYIEYEGRHLNTAGTGNAGVGFKTYGPTKAQITWTNAAAYGTTKSVVWAKKSGTYTVPAGTAFLQPWITFSNNGETTNRFWVDNVVIRRKANATMVVDGLIQANSLIVATGAISSAQIANLDAAKITTGTLSAARIGAKSITTDKLVITSTDNLVVEADFSNGGASWGTLSANKAINATAGRGSLPALRITGSTALQSLTNLVNKVTTGSDERLRGAFYIKSTAALAAGAAKLRMNCYTTATAFTTVTIATSALLVANTWTLVEGIAAALPAGTIAVEFLLEVTNDATGTITDIDYVSVTRATDGNLVVDGTITANKLETTLVLSSTIIAGNQTGTHARMDSSGFRVFAADPGGGTVPNEVVRMGVAASNDYFALTKSDGSLAATISQDGVISGQALYANNSLYYRGQELNTTLDYRGTGLIAAAQRTTSSAQNAYAGGPFVPYLRLEVPIKAYRLYKIWTSAIRVNTDSGVGCTVALAYQQSPYIADINNAAIFTRANIQPSPNGGASFVTLQELFAVPTDTTLSLLIMFGVQENFGPGTQAAIRAASDTPVRLVVEDMGPTRTSVTNGAWLDGNAPPPPAKNTYVKQYVCNNSMNYDGNNNQYTYNVGQMYQGQSPAGYGNLKSIGLFPDMTADLSGSTINYIRVYFNFNFWYYNAGGTARIGVHGHTGIPGTYTSVGPLTAVSGSWPKPGARWVDIDPAHWDSFKSGAYRGVYLEGDGTYNTYGYADRPTIEISYTK